MGQAIGLAPFLYTIVKKIFTCFIATALCILGLASEELAAQQSRLDFCQIYGGIYFVQDRAKANFSVYLEESETFANLKVYQQNNILFADRSGQWYITENKVQANYLVYIETKRSMADFTIHYVSAESYAGCTQ